jgi:hypothetical protein
MQLSKYKHLGVFLVSRGEEGSSTNTMISESKGHIDKAVMDARECLQPDIVRANPPDYFIYTANYKE